tara:strand:+ start:535 stop:717 length:183 start_codon:yes stop_codon:yes gene_type:complete
MTEVEEVKEKIKDLKEKLTGDLFNDIELQQKIYELKKILVPEIVEEPELDNDEDCLYCGS